MQSAPPGIDSIRDRLSALMPELRKRYSVRSISIFGSYARGEQTPESDLDLLVEFYQTPGMVRFVGLAHQLEDSLGLSVDLFTRAMLKARVAPNVLRELRPV